MAPSAKPGCMTASPHTSGEWAEASGERMPSITAPSSPVVSLQLVPRSFASCSFGSSTFGAESSFPDGLKSASCFSNRDEAAEGGNFIPDCSSTLSQARRFVGFADLPSGSIVLRVSCCFTSPSHAAGDATLGIAALTPARTNRTRASFSGLREGGRFCGLELSRLRGFPPSTCRVEETLAPGDPCEWWCEDSSFRIVWNSPKPKSPSSNISTVSLSPLPLLSPVWLDLWCMREMGCSSSLPCMSSPSVEQLPRMWPTSKPPLPERGACLCMSFRPRRASLDVSQLSLIPSSPAACSSHAAPSIASISARSSASSTCVRRRCSCAPCAAGAPMRSSPAAAAAAAAACSSHATPSIASISTSPYASSSPSCKCASSGTSCAPLMPNSSSGDEACAASAI
mmetsp:Transcript_13716/g.34213  ORF Transcript_13716/g.34213 Transcript_13716/m.34213 type:complete len:398 (-) Transcript_13716:903-2096(-)